VLLVLRNTTTRAVFTVTLAADPRRWQAGTSAVVAENVAVPTSLPVGTYELLLGLPDAAPALSTNPDYAIRMATNGVWEPATGLNKLLRTITVTAS
jgi:hypothetical protein